MKNLFVEGSIDVPYEAQPNKAALTLERLPVLVARGAATMLQDSALTSLFHSFRVELFKSPFDLFAARAAPVSYALLCASAGCPLLSAEAYIIRKQWPLSRIVVLGAAPYDLEDHLYDETVATNCSASTLTAAFCHSSVDLWDRRNGWNIYPPEPPLILEESDPTKAKSPSLQQPTGADLRGLPADERRGASRVASSKPVTFFQA